MNTRLTELVFILDRSGSMGSLIKETIAGFNQFLQDHQSAPGDARMTLVLFDDRIEIPIDSMPIAEVPPLNRETYVLGGSTALLDAIGITIDQTGARLAATSEPERPGKVIFAILTDGQENASRRYSAREITKRITHQREKYAWEFLFLGANQDAIATAAHLGMDDKNAATFCADNAGTMASHASISRKSMAMRKIAMNEAQPADFEDWNRSTSEILREEDAKRRRPQDG